MRKMGRRILTAVFLATLTLPLAALEGEFIYTQGAVFLVRGADRMEAEIGLTVEQGDIIETGAEAMAVISIPNNAELKLRENTRIAMDSLGEQLQVNLKKGGLFSRVVRRLTGRFSVRTETAVAGVRGTEFFMAFGRTIDDNPDIWLCVNEGTVEVAIVESDESVLVEEGEGINIVGGNRLTKPRFYPWTQKLNWNSDPRAGEVSDRTDLDQAYSDLLDQDYD